ncbi:MAG: thiol:disulfide interchange protein DsbA/DsbL [Gammaproteobacteria bacterium]
MNHRFHAFIAILFLLAAGFTHAADPYEEAYRQISPTQPTQTDDKIEVVEIFWYGCPHCYDFEPHIERWHENAPDDVAFRRMPAVLNQSWIPHARAYYTAAKLGVLEQIHKPLFDALHRERKRIFSESDLRDFFVSRGVDGGDFTRVYNSNEVETKIKQAYFMARNYKLTGVPSVVVNGKYMTSASMTGTYEKLIQVIDHLVEKER